jgi:hypothetical protein
VGFVRLWKRAAALIPAGGSRISLVTTDCTAASGVSSDEEPTGTLRVTRHRREALV